MFKKLTLFFMVLFLSLEAAERIWENPYKVPQSSPEGNYEIKNFSISSYDAGFNDDPKTVEMKFNLYKGRERYIATNLKSSLICDGKEISVEGEIGFKGRSYYKKIKMPSGKNYSKCYPKVKGDEISYMGDRPISYKEKKLNLVFLVDNSGSMKINDPSNKRLSSLKKIIETNSSVNKVAVLGFSDDIQILWDWEKVNKIADLEDALNVPISYGNTDIGLAFEKVQEYIKNKKKNDETISVVFLTDGYPSTIYKDEHQLLSKESVPVYSIGFGNGNGFNQALLKKIAFDTGGKYFVSDPSSIESTYDKIIKNNTTPLENSMILYNDDFDDNELLIFKVPKRYENLRLIVNGEMKDKFYDEVVGDVRELAFYPMVVGKYEGTLVYDEWGGGGKQKVDFGVRHNEKRNFVFISGSEKNLGDNEQYRFPFKLQNNSDEKQLYHLSFLKKTSKETNNFLNFEEKVLSLDSQGQEALSVSVDGRDVEREKKGYYFVIENSMRKYLYDVDLHTENTYAEVKRVEETNSDRWRLSISELIIGSLWSLTFLSLIFWKISSRRRNGNRWM